METTPSSITPQEKLSASLASIFFFAPYIMGTKTDYVVRYMKQGFFINVIQFLCSFMSMILWFFTGFLGFVSFVFFIISLVLAYRAYQGEVYTISWIYENAERTIQALAIGNMFTPNK